MPVIIAIESSCDDTSVAVWRDGKILSNISASQAVHAKYGGVIPELASRAHLQHIIPVLDMALKSAKIDIANVDAVAATIGPGLIGSLMVGVNLAKSLAVAWGKPFIGVNHIQAHILSPLIGSSVNTPSFPYLCLVVSGGHTQIVRVASTVRMEIMGQTLDDAAGEAFDKCAKMLGLPYPGGPLLDKLAQTGNPNAYKFPSPHLEGYDFSFSGFKTSVMYFIQNQTKADKDFVENHKHDLAASIQSSIVGILLKTFLRASNDSGIKQLAIAGGVSANSYLRFKLKELEESYNVTVNIPAFEYCTDNAAMIAQAAYYKYEAGLFDDLTLMPMARITN